MRWIPTESSRTSGIEKRVQNSFWNCTSMLLVVTTSSRLPRPRRINSLQRMPHSNVLPRPTASAINSLWRGIARALAAGSSW